MKVFLLRQWIDTSIGGYYSPLYEDGCYDLIPRPSPKGIPYRNLRAKCMDKGLDVYLPIDSFRVRNRFIPVSRLVTTGCPFLEKAVFCDETKYLSSLEPREGDYIILIAGMARYPKNFFRTRWRLTNIKQVFDRSPRGLYIVGFFRIGKIVDTATLGWDESVLIDPRIKDYGTNTNFSQHTIFYLGSSRESRVFESPIKIATYSWRGLTYISLPGLKRFKPHYFRRLILKGKTAELLISYLETIP